MAPPRPRQTLPQFLLYGLIGLGFVTSLPAACAQTPTGAAAPTLSQILDSSDPLGLGRVRAFASAGSDPTAPTVLPLAFQNGAGSGLSFLYYTPPALTVGQDGKVNATGPQRATYGFSNSFALGGSSAGHLQGLMYMGGGATVNGRQAQSQVISQALDYGLGAWKLQAHFQSVGKNFAGFDALRGQSSSLGMLGDMTSDSLGALQKARGQDDLGIAANYATKLDKFSLTLNSVSDAVKKLRTQQQSLAFGRAFAGGLQLDASRDSVTTDGIDGSTAQSKTTVSQRLALAFSGTKGTTLAAEYKTQADSTGKDQSSLGFSLGQKTKDLTMAASFQQLSPSSGQGGAQTTQHVQMNWQATRTLALDSTWTDQKNVPNQQGDDSARLVHLTWQLHKDLTFESRWSQESATRWVNAAAAREMLLRGLVARNVTVEAKLASSAQGGATRNTGNEKNLKAVITAPRLVGMSHVQWMFSLADRISQSQLQNSVRALTFDAEARHNLVHLEYAGTLAGAGKTRTNTVSRALRIVANQPSRWLQYSAYYKQRDQSGQSASTLHDVRDYQVKMQRRNTAFEYHYVNQRENADGSVTDLVQTSFQLSAPLTKSLLWSAQYNQSNVAAGTAGTHGFLFGVKGAITSGEQLEVAYGRQQTLAGAKAVQGETYKLNYQAKASDTDLIEFDGQLTTWDDKTPQTPDQMLATVRVDVKKQY